MKKVLLSAVTAFLLTPLWGQFQHSSLPEIRITGSEDPGAHIHYVTNYSYGNLSFSDFQSDLYVSTDRARSTPTFHYKRTRTNDASNVIDEGWATLPYPGTIFDAVILRNFNASAPNPFLAAVVYDAGPNGGRIAFFEWTLSGLTLAKDIPFTTDDIVSMRMDANNLDYYTVVYATPNDELYSFGGAMPSGTYPLVGAVKEIYGNATPGVRGKMPDVAMTRLSNPPPNMATTGIKLYYSYIGPDQDECLVSYLGFDELMTLASPIALNYEHTIDPIPVNNPVPPCGVIGTYPRYYYSKGPLIDAPDFSNDSWSLIVQQHESHTLSNCIPITNQTVGLWVSAAYKMNGGIIHDIRLNNGSLGTPDMSQSTYPFSNPLVFSLPAVAFSNDSQWLNFAWGKTQDNAALGNRDYIGLAYDPIANAVIPASTGERYRIVDFDASLHPYVPAISFSGQNTTTFDLYTVFTADVNNPSYSECVTKSIRNGGILFRLATDPRGWKH